MIFCNICLRSGKDCKIIDGSSFINIFMQLVGVTELSELKLCAWCLAVLRKTLRLQQMYLETQTRIKNNIQIRDQNIKELFKYECYSSSFDILPSEDGSIQTITESHVHGKGDEHSKFVNKLTNEVESNEIIPNNYNGNTDVSKKRKCNRRNVMMFKRMDFEVSYLSVKEQIDDVNNKKCTKKFMNMYHRCEYCAKGFVTLESFEEHKLRHTMSAGEKICPICKLHFKSREVFTQHALAHYRRFTCVRCDATFKRWSHCIRHRYKCTPRDVAVGCKMCAKIFNDEQSLYTHAQTVHRTKKHICNDCGKIFATKQRLIVHNRSHTGDKPYTCTICSKKFTTNSNLRSHAAVVHTSTKEFYCVECNKYYKSSKNLQRHFTESMKHRTKDDLAYICSECSMTFRSEMRLRTPHQDTPFDYISM